MVRLKDIAEMSGVSIATVSRILNHDNNFSVKDETRQLVLKIAKEQNYNFKNKVTNTPLRISVISSISSEDDSENPYFLELRKSIEQVLKNENYLINYHNANVISIDSLKKNADYYIILGQIDLKLLQPLLSKKNNILFVGSSPNPVNYDSIRPNFEMAMMDIFDYIHTLEINSVGFIGGNVTKFGNSKRRDFVINERYEAFRIYANHSELYQDNYVHFTKYGIKYGYDIMKKIIHRQNLADLYVISNDLLSIGAIKALTEAKYSIPEDVKIISFDDTDYAKYSPISITSVNLNIGNMANAIIPLLNSRLDGRDFPMQVSIPADLKIREST